MKVPVPWTQHFPTEGFTAEYLSVAAWPGALPREVVDEDVVRALDQLQLLYPTPPGGETKEADHQDDAAFAAGLLAKFLRRGTAPPPTLGIEEAALQQHELLPRASCLHAPGDGAGHPVEMGWELRGRSLAARSILAAAAERDAYACDPRFGHDPQDVGSEFRLTAAEDAFLRTWVAGTLGDQAGHWFIPQAPLDTLIRASEATRGNRRVDFLFCHPFATKPVVIEIDGPEHHEAAGVDAARDRDLEQRGFAVFRISNDDALRGGGAALDEFRRCYEAVASRAKEVAAPNEARFALSCARATQVQFALVRALELGFLRPGHPWAVRLSGADAVAVAGVWDLLRLLKALDQIYGIEASPTICSVEGEEAIEARYWAGDDWQPVSAPTDAQPDVHIVAEWGASAFHRLPASSGFPCFVLRPAFLPMDIAGQGALARAETRKAQRNAPTRALRVFLQEVFRKFDFRDGQAQALRTVLRGDDCLVLLPTGAGKSIIYQLAGMLLPGWTLVVDPLVALIEDQVSGMRRYGLDRVKGIHGGTGEDQKGDIYRAVSSGACHFLLLAPERLQIGRFRTELRGIVEQAPVNLAVVDEAHCVSEWGHDFRPAYLNLGVNIRDYCKAPGGDPPPVLGLTGTASRAVLRDTLVELGIDRRRSDAVIRPESFNRPELRFQTLRHGSRAKARDALPGILGGIPSRMRLPAANFWQPRGRDTASGIVFCRTVRGLDGLDDVAKAVEKATHRQPATYSGTRPRNFRGDAAAWERHKRKEARRFTQDEVSVLVSTKAFGMGIDKPNVRFVLIYGLPSSIEEFYQLAGRAGRDQRPAHCLLVATEWDERETEHLLGDRCSFDDLTTTAANWDTDRKWMDDLATQLYFHRTSFAGRERDLEAIDKVLADLGTSRDRRLNVRLAFAGNERDQEKAIYRLRRVGVVADYRKEWGSRYFEIDIAAPDRDAWRGHLGEYLRAAQPATSKPWLDRLDRVPHGVLRDVARAFAEVLVDFTYDSIEKSRRRMMLEGFRWTRESRTDEAIRQRMLEYLQEGDWASEVGELVDEGEIDLLKWWELITEKAMTGVEAGELRGICIRVLESDPEHPGLRIARGVLEAFCLDGQETIAAAEIASALERCKRLGVAAEHVESWAQASVAFVSEDPERGVALAAPLAWAFSGFASRGDRPPTNTERLRELAPRNETTRRVATAARLEDAWLTLEGNEPTLRSWLGAHPSLAPTKPVQQERAESP